LINRIAPYVVAWNDSFMEPVSHRDRQSLTETRDRIDHTGFVYALPVSYTRRGSHALQTYYTGHMESSFATSLRLIG